MASLVDNLKRIAEDKQAIIDGLRKGVPDDIGAVIEQLAELLDEYTQDIDGLSLSELASVEQLDNLLDLIKDAGIDEYEIELRDKVSAIADKLRAQLDETGLSVGQRSLDEKSLRAFVEYQVRDVTDTFKANAAKSIQRAWVQSTFSGKPLVQAVEDATTESLHSLSTLTAKQVETHIGTAVAGIDRSITASVGRGEGDAEIVYVYIGPNDGVVRDSCQHIVGKWLTRNQISQLRNAQIPDAFANAGGWNCRHSWAPIRKSVAISRGVKQATQEDIDGFNRDAKGPLK